MFNCNIVYAIMVIPKKKKTIMIIYADPYNMKNLILNSLIGKMNKSLFNRTYPLEY